MNALTIHVSTRHSVHSGVRSCSKSVSKGRCLRRAAELSLSREYSFGMPPICPHSTVQTGEVVGHIVDIPRCCTARCGICRYTEIGYRQHQDHFQRLSHSTHLYEQSQTHITGVLLRTFQRSFRRSIASTKSYLPFILLSSRINASPFIHTSRE